MGGAAIARAGLVVSLVLALGGCGLLAPDRTGSSPEPRGPAPSPVSFEVGGLTIHHLEHGKLRTIEVEHFRR